MAKKSMIQKQKKREALVEQYREVRADLIARGDYDGLKKLPRDSSPTRLNNRCRIDGRPRGYMRQFGLSRIKFRELASLGQIPGVTKSSF